MRRYSILLLLVALMLPVRGALAAVGLFCHVDRPHSVAAASEHQHDAASHSSPDASHQAAQHDHSTGHDAPAQSDTCKYCASVCSVPPVAPVDLTLHEPVSPGSEPFAAVTVSPPGPYVSGLERPPRTI
jgi:hypothetical protein